MAESNMLDLSTVIGLYPLCDARAVLLHKIDYGEDKVLASINGEGAEWCSITEEYRECAGELELGFYLGSLFIPFSEVMRFYGGAE